MPFPTNYKPNYWSSVVSLNGKASWMCFNLDIFHLAIQFYENCMFEYSLKKSVVYTYQATV